MLTRIGHNLGLFEAAAQGPATSAELAAHTGLHERYVREWLGAMTTGRILTYEAALDCHPRHARLSQVGAAQYTAVR